MRGPSHYLKQCRKIMIWTNRNKFQWNWNQITAIACKGNAFENGLCKMAVILSRPQKIPMGLKKLTFPLKRCRGINIKTFCDSKSKTVLLKKFIENCRLLSGGHFSMCYVSSAIPCLLHSLAIYPPKHTITSPHHPVGILEFSQIVPSNISHSRQPWWAAACILL